MKFHLETITYEFQASSCLVSAAIDTTVGSGTRVSANVLTRAPPGSPSPPFATPQHIPRYPPPRPPPEARVGNVPV